MNNEPIIRKLLHYVCLIIAVGGALFPQFGVVEQVQLILVLAAIALR